MRSIEAESASGGSVASLLTAAAVRARCRLVYAAGLAGRLQHFAVRPDKLPAAADYVADTIRLNYPTLDVPFHARWRHFTVAGADSWLNVVGPVTADTDLAERARARFDLVIPSVLLDAGAGPAWRWAHDMVDRNGRATVAQIGRSEGLALASLDAWKNGLFSSRADTPLRTDAGALQGVTVEALAKAFDVRQDNPLQGLDGRAGLLNALGAAIAARPDLFGAEGRLGGLYDTLARRAVGGRLPAPQILGLILEALGPIWPGRLALDGTNLGDTWRHTAADVPGPTCGLVPFHKLSQWLSYSLMEPLQEAGIEVTDIDGLTGLAEYRNGGLFIDLGVLAPKDATLPGQRLAPSAEPIVEWRALTVVLLDEIAPLVRERLGLDAAQLPLAAVLEGGTWSAGRRIAKALRPDGGPPLTIDSDGSVF